jgi:hypothetical protein
MHSFICKYWIISGVNTQKSCSVARRAQSFSETHTFINKSGSYTGRREDSQKQAIPGYNQQMSVSDQFSLHQRT